MTSTLQLVELVIVIALGVAVLAVMIIVAKSSNDFTAPMLVLTGLRTRSPSGINTFSMRAASQDPHERLYSCMMQTEIGRDVCPDQMTIKSYKTCVQRYIGDCSPYADAGWPRDFGFTACVVDKYFLSPHQTNMFLDCQDRAEGVMWSTIQSPFTTTFLGSYNYVAFLISGMGVMVIFLMVSGFGTHVNTAAKAISVNDRGHIDTIWGVYSPWMMFAALLCSFVGFVISIYTMFPLQCGEQDIWCPDGKYSFLSTPWTGTICTGVFAVIMGFLTVNLLEYYMDWVNAPEPEIDHGRGVASSFYFAHPHSAHSGLRHRFAAPQASMRLGQLFKRDRSKATENNSEALIAEVLPHLLTLQSMMWVLSDGFIFLGMLSPLNSPYVENTVFTFTLITLCRLLQLALAKFIPLAFLGKTPTPGSSSIALWSSKNDPNSERGLEMPALTVYFASLFFMAGALYNFTLGMEFVNKTTPAGIAAQAVQITFIMVAVVLPELIRLGFIVWISVGYSANSTVLYVFEFVFIWETVLKFALSVAAVFSVTGLIQTQQQTLKTFLGVN
jgi:hypothetical protein